jgi:hypothetical protein
VTDKHSGFIQHHLHTLVVVVLIGTVSVVKWERQALALVCQHTHHDQRIVWLKWVKVHLAITLGDGILYVKC